MMASILNGILDLNRTVRLGGTKTQSFCFDRSSGAVCRRTPLSICSCEKCFGLSAAAPWQALAPVHSQLPLPSLDQKWRTRPSTSSRHRGYVPCVSLLYSRTVVETMDKAVVDLGKSESTAGLTFVCLSRAKRLVDLLIEPMTFERFSKLGNKPTLQLRLREEVRLRALAGETLHHHRGVA